MCKHYCITVLWKDGSVSRGISNWKFLGQEVCFTGFTKISNLSKRKLQKIVKVLNSGDVTLPVDGRTERHWRPTPMVDHVWSFFQFLYDNVAEPLAEGESVQDDGDFTSATDEYADWIDNAPTHPSELPPETDMDPVGCTSLDLLSPRWLNPTTPAELFDWYLFMHECVPFGSNTTFMKAWKKWKKCLKIRQNSQHARCTT